MELNNNNNAQKQLFGKNNIGKNRNKLQYDEEIGTIVSLSNRCRDSCDQNVGIPFPSIVFLECYDNGIPHFATHPNILSIFFVL